MDRSCVGVAAISWMIACGLFYGVAGGIGTAQAGADPGTANNSPSRPDSGRATDSNASAADQHGGDQRKLVSGGLVGSNRLPGPFNVNPRDVVAFPVWPWPCPQCVPEPGGVLGSPRTSLRGIPPPQSAGGGGARGSGGGIAVTVPTPTVPGQPGEPTPIQVGGGGHESAPTGEPPTVDMPPVIGIAPVEVPLRPVGTPSGTGPAAETGARPAAEPNPIRERPPARVGSATEAPASSRVGYPQYLREAKTGEVIAVALPGVVGLLALTALGGVVGYRQARAGHLVRAAGTARFL